MKNVKFRSITLRLAGSDLEYLQTLKDRLENFYARRPCSLSEVIRACLDETYRVVTGKALTSPQPFRMPEPIAEPAEVPKSKPKRKTAKAKPKKPAKPSTNGKIKKEKPQPVV